MHYASPTDRRRTAIKTTQTFLNSLLVACLAISCVACSNPSIESPRSTTAPEDMTEQPDSVDKPGDEETITPEAIRIVNLDVSSDGTELDQLEVEPPGNDGMVVFRITAQDPFLAQSMDPSSLLVTSSSMTTTMITRTPHSCIERMSARSLNEVSSRLAGAWAMAIFAVASTSDTLMSVGITV